MAGRVPSLQKTLDRINGINGIGRAQCRWIGSSRFERPEDPRGLDEPLVEENVSPVFWTIGDGRPYLNVSAGTSRSTLILRAGKRRVLLSQNPPFPSDVPVVHPPSRMSETMTAPVAPAKYRTAPDPKLTGMPPGVPYIIGNEAPSVSVFTGCGRS